MSADPAPLIVSALFGAEDFAWLDALRRAHFPPERNRLSAHLTLFHHLPPSLAPELGHRLREAVRARRPRAQAAGLMSLGGGVAIRIVAPELVVLRDALAAAFAGILTPQDAASWRPHVTIQNKVSAVTARAPRQADPHLRPTRRGRRWAGDVALPRRTVGIILAPHVRQIAAPAQSIWPMPSQLRSKAARPASR